MLRYLGLQVYVYLIVCYFIKIDVLYVTSFVDKYDI